MFSNGKSILVQPMQRDDLILNTIDSRLIDIQQKITDLLSAGYVIYDVASATNSNFNNLIASSSGNRICIWKSAGSTAYTLYSTELASNGTNVIINAQINNMNQVTAIRDCKLTCSASSGLFANKAEFYGGDWYIASWTTGSNVKFTNCDVISQSSEIYMPDVNFEYCNVRLTRSGTIAYSTFKLNQDTRFVNETTAGSTTSTLTLSYAYTTDSDWFTRCTLVDWQNTGTAVISSTAQRTLNFTGLKIENSNLAMTNVYTTEGNKIYYEGQDLVLSGSLTAQAWSALGGNISSSSGTYPSIAVDSNGIQYVAFRDNSTGGAGKASCYKYGSTGWSVVGYVGLSSNPMDYVNICISSSNGIYIVGRDNSSKASAYYLSAAASSWNLLGSAGFTTNNINKIEATYTYGFASTGYGNFILTLCSNSSGSNYLDHYRINIGTTTYSWELKTIANSSILYNDIAISLPRAYTLKSSNNNVDSYLYNILSGSYTLSYSNIFTTNINKIFTERLTNNIYIAGIDNSSKINVVDYGGFSLGNLQFSTGTAQNGTFALINSIQYVAIEDTTAKATVYKYIAANSSWNLFGTANFSTDNVGRMQLASYAGTPYLAVEEVGVAPGISVYTFGETISNSNINYSFENLDTDIFDGEKSLDITTIQSTANYIVQNCKVNPGYNIVDTAVGRFIRNTYNIELAPGWGAPVDDLLKESNANTFWVVKREDIEATLNGKIIKNLKLYNADLSAYNYNSNDNFIIIANNAIKGNAVFCFYNGKIKGTVLSDWFLDVSYTITNCIILMEVNEIQDLQNVVPTTSLADAPLASGTITFNSFDNEIIV